MSSSDLKLKFANYFLKLILDFDEKEYPQQLPIELSETTQFLHTNNTKTSTNTALILERLNCFIECYFFTAMSSLDALIHEIVDKFSKIKKPKKLKITYFFNTQLGPEIKDFVNEFKKQSIKLFDCIYKFVNDGDFKDFNGYRNFVAHKSILKKEFSFNTTETTDESYSTLKRPLLLPQIINNELSIESKNLETYLKTINDKIINFHKNIKLIINENI